MPKKLEQELKKKAKAKGLGKKRTGTYVYGTLRKTGWKPMKEIEKRVEKKYKKKKYKKVKTRSPIEKAWSDIKKKVGTKVKKALASGTTKVAILERRKAEKREGTIKRGPGAWTGRWEHQKHKKKSK